MIVPKKKIAPQTIPPKTTAVDDAITFYSDKEVPYGAFSNFYRSPITIDGVSYPTTEHYYQAQKFAGSDASADAKEYAELIRIQTTPMKAKVLAVQKIGGGYPWRTLLNTPIQEYLDRGVQMRSDWEEIKDDVMRRAVYAKFSQHPKLLEILKQTRQHMLIERSPTDSYWGCGRDGTGKNMLGRILVETRTMLTDV